MDIKLFTDIIDAIAKVGEGLKTIAGMPKAERAAIRQTLEDTYRLIDTTLNMIIIRLGDIMLPGKEDSFIDEVIRLENFDGWINAEREFRLCRSLRVAQRETETFLGKLTSVVSVKDLGSLKEQMQALLATEGEVAAYISLNFRQIADEARNANQDIQKILAVRAAITDFRNALVKEHVQLINNEIELLSIV